MQIRQLCSSQLSSSAVTLNVAVGHNNIHDHIVGNYAPGSRRDLSIDVPQLTPRELLLLSRGERIQKQTRTGRSGFGMVVVDVPAEENVVFNTLCDFERYCIGSCLVVFHICLFSFTLKGTRT